MKLVKSHKKLYFLLEFIFLILSLFPASRAQSQESEKLFDSINIAEVPAHYSFVRALKQPLLVLAGSKDEAFIANEFEKAINTYSRGEVYLIQGATHNGIRHHLQSAQRIKAWFEKFQLN